MCCIWCVAVYGAELVAGEGFGYVYEGVKWCRLRIYFCVVANSKDDDVTICALFFLFVFI